MKNNILILLVLISSLCFYDAKSETENSLSHESELGMIITDGNSDTKTINFKQTTTKKWINDKIIFSAHYLYGTSMNVLSARNWHLNLRYERILTEKFSIYAGTGIAGDKFAGYRYRYHGELGGKYYFINSKNFIFFNETGYQYEFEKKLEGNIPQDQTAHFGRTYFEILKYFTETFYGRIWNEFLLDLSETNNYRFNFEPSINLVVIEFLTFKFSYLGKYTNRPAVSGLKNYDSILTTALIAKF